MQQIFHYKTVNIFSCFLIPVGKITKKTVWRSAFLSKNSTILSKIHAYILPFRRFCPLGFGVYILLTLLLPSRKFKAWNFGEFFLCGPKILLCRILWWSQIW